MQAKREYYVAMCALETLPSLCRADGEDLSPALRAQRVLNRGRIPQLVRYVIENPDSYVFSSIAASVDAEPIFVPFGKSGFAQKIGELRIPEGATLLINDGQHRLAAIRELLKKHPELGTESISIVLYADAGLSRSQQMFADLNRYAVRPTRSLNILYDHRDQVALLARLLTEQVPVFSNMTEMERNTISNRQRKLFTLNGIYHATQKLLGKTAKDTVSKEEESFAVAFWTQVGNFMPEWLAASEGKAHPFELRKNRIHAHGIALQAIATAGATLIAEDRRSWRRRLSALSEINWMRENVLWEGRALAGGKVCKAGNHVTLTSNVIKNALGLSLNEAERKVEDVHETSRRQQRSRRKEGDPHKGKTGRPPGDDRSALPRRQKAMGDRVQRR